MNHFIARLIFCFFAEDTDIFRTADLFTSTIEKMSASDSSNTHEVISEILRSMNTQDKDSNAAGIARWAKDFPAEIARLALIIAEYQCDVLHRGQKETLAEFLPLDAKNWITCGNALRLD